VPAVINTDAVRDLRDPVAGSP